MFKISRFRTPHAWAALLAVLVVALLPSLALAQAAGGAGPFTVDSTDLSKRIFLDYLFGPLTGAGDSPLTSIVKIFNGAVLFLGGVFMAYTIIAGTMATAHDGEMLGRKWSSLWLPIRTTLGAAAVMPVIGGGWCAAQAVVVWLATLGIGIANAMWGAYISNGNMLGEALYSPPNMSGTAHKVFENMLMSNICVAAFQADNNQALQQQPASANLLGSGNDNYGVQTLSGTQGTQTLAYGTGYEAMTTSSTCGRINFPAVDTTATAAPSDPTGGTGAGQWSSYTGRSLLNMPEVNSKLLPQQNAAIMNAQGTLWALAVKIVQADGDGTDEALQNEVNTTLDSLTQTYSNTSIANAKAAYQGAVNQSYLTTMAQDGWVTAGAFYMEIARAQDQLTEAVTTVPTASASWSGALQSAAEAGKQGWWDSMFNSVPENVISSMSRGLKMTRTSHNASSGGVASITDAENAQEGMEGGLANRFVAAFTSSHTKEGWFSGENNDEGTGLNQNPIISAKNLGSQMINWAWSAFAIMAGIGLFTLGGAGVGAFTIIAGPFTMIFSTLIVGGSTLAFYLPMLPFILWMGVVLGWAVLLVEAVIAAPLWAVVHMAPDADGVVGRGGQGYMLVLSLTLRPALMVVGLVAAISLMRPLGFLINSTFGGAFAISRGPSFGGLTAMVAGCAIYSGLMVSVVNRVFALIHVVPDRLLRWIGGGGNELGGEATAIEQGSAGKMVAATGAMRELSSQGQGMLSGARQINAAKRQEEQAREGKEAQQQGNIGDNVNRADSAASRAFGQATEDPSDQMAQSHALSEVRNARAESLRGAVGAAKIAGGAGKSGPQADEARRFVSAFEEAKGGGEQGMVDFIKSESDAAASRQQQDPSSVQPFHSHIMRARKNQQRMGPLEENITHIPSPPPAGGAGGGADHGDHEQV
jgi:conjugal transfer/type IV secretion protein DotA/TraY